MKKNRSRSREEFVPDREPPSLEVKEALDVIETIVETIEDKVSDSAKRSAGDFFESIEDRAKDIGKTIEKNNKVSDKQRQALDNMLTAVRKWVHEDD